jgi:hypothetical protein
MKFNQSSIRINTCIITQIDDNNNNVSVTPISFLTRRGVSLTRFPVYTTGSQEKDNIWITQLLLGEKNYKDITI